MLLTLGTKTKQLLHLIFCNKFFVEKQQTLDLLFMLGHPYRHEVSAWVKKRVYRVGLKHWYAPLHGTRQVGLRLPTSARFPSFSLLSLFLSLSLSLFPSFIYIYIYILK